MDSTVTESSPTDCVKVAVRVRPLIARERGCTDIAIFCDSKANEIIIDGNSDKRFTYNYTFDTNSKQEDIYNTCVIPLLDSAFEGYNATVLAYGQTGSGKTYTMGTAGKVTNNSDVGIVPRVIDDIFQRKSKLEKEYPGCEILIHVSFLEIYAENVRDLLEFDQGITKEVLIRSDDQGGVKVIGQKTQQVTSAEELQEVLDTGSLYRATGNTSMNAFSSRSHAIFTIYIDQEIPLKSEGGTDESEKAVDIRQSKFHFVDLAGSERASRTNTEGQRMKEGIDINRGLLALGKVIRALGDEKNKGTFPPYRESKLTRLLMDSLGGNAKTLMIACVSPASDSLNESLGSLRYANSAKNIQNKPKVNKDANSSLITQLRLENQQLRELLAMKGDMDPEMAMKLAKARIDQGKEELLMEIDEKERKMLEERAVEAENRVKALEEELREVKRQLEDEKSKGVNLSAELEYYKRNGLDAELTEEGKKEISLIAEYKKKLEELNEQLQQKEEKIDELLNQNTEQATKIINNKMELIDLRYRPHAELMYEATNRLHEKLAKGGVTDETEDDLQESIEDVEEDLSIQERINVQKFKNMEARLKMKEKELQIMTEDYNNLQNRYEGELNDLNTRIIQMESERNKLNMEMDSLKKNTKGGKEVSAKQKELENKLKEKNDEINRIKMQKKDLEKTVENLKSTQQRINRLTKDIEELKTGKVQLTRQIESNKNKYRQELGERTREIRFLNKQINENTRKINEYQQASRKMDALLHKKEDENALLQKRIKEQKLCMDVQKRDYERFAKEDRKQVRWLEKQLQLEKKKNQQIAHLEQRLQQKNAAIEKLKELEKQREMRQRKKRVASRQAETDLSDRYEQEEIDDAIEQARVEANVTTTSVDDIMRLMKAREFDQETVVESFRSMSREDTVTLLEVVYKRLIEYMKEINKLNIALGEKETNIEDLYQKQKRLERRLETQKTRFENQLKEYNSQLTELRQDRNKEELIHSKISDAQLKVEFIKLLKSYEAIKEDYFTMKNQRDRFRSLYNQLKNEESDEVKPVVESQQFQRFVKSLAAAKSKNNC